MPERPRNSIEMTPKEGFFDALYYIKQVGNYEARILWRSWLFRIFAILILVILVLFNLFGIIGIAGSEGWPGRYIPGNVAYMNFFIFTVAQVIIAAFLSADFLGRERKMDTTEVFYTRPMSNLQYVLGKTWGALQLFFGLSVIVFLLSGVVTLVTPGAAFAVKPMLFYLFVFSLPSLVFILGFSFILMTLVRNQAVTFVLVLGFGATVLFYLQNMHSGIWDFMGFYLPMHYSGFSGFCNVELLVMQRTGFLLLGFSGVLLTAFFLPRLPGHHRRSPFIVLTSVCMMLGSGALFFEIVHRDQKALFCRETIVQNEQALPNMPLARIDSCHLQVIHSGSSLTCSADLQIKKLTNTDSLIFMLNQGFRVKEVLVNRHVVAFSRRNGLLYIPVTEGGVDDQGWINCRINYVGAPDEGAIYPCVDEKNRALLNRIDPLVAGKRYSFVQNQFVLLTRETGWYPVIAWKYFRQQSAFTKYSLSFKTENGLQPLSQGEWSVSGDWFNSHNHQPLNALTLLAGHYQIDSVEVDSVEYLLAVDSKYNTIKQSFTHVSDTLPSLIRSLKRQYESKLGLKYPFSSLKIVEVPVHFFSYLQPWNMATDHTQPEMLLVPENGGGAWFGDVFRLKSDFEKVAKRQGQDMQPMEVEARTFVTLVGTVLLYPGWQFQRNGQQITRDVGEWNRVQVFPLYYDYVYHIYEKNFPIFRVMLGDALRKSGSKRQNSFVWGGGRNQYRSLLNLNRKSLNQWLTGGVYNDTVAGILKLQGINFFSRVSALSGKGTYYQTLKRGFDQYQFKNTTPSQWLSLLDGESGCSQAYNEIKVMDDLPEFTFGDMKATEVTEDELVKYHVSFEVSNTGDMAGLLDTYTTFLNLKENRGGGFSHWMYQNVSRQESGQNRLYLVPAHKKVKVEMVFDQIPRNVKVETGVARNIPPFYNYSPGEFKKNGSAPDREGVRILGEASPKQELPGVYIVDNEDPGFTIESKNEIKTLKDWWIRRQGKKLDDYKEMNFWRPPVNWTAGFGANFFGRHKLSAVQKVAGNGEDVAQWKCDLPEPGNYEIQVYIPKNLYRSWRFRKAKAGFNYKIYYAQGEKRLESPPVDEVNGWVSLGRYYFNKGESVVELSDRTNYQYVVADAVKWIKQ